MIADSSNRVPVSAASVWEIAIQRRLGKPAFEGSPTDAIAANGFEDLAILPIDTELAGGLVVTADTTIRDYAGAPLLRGRG